MARNHPISYCILLAILLAVPLTNAAMDYQAALLTQFIEYQQAQAAKSATAAGPAETDPWADPVRSFGDLPTNCSDPKGSKGADRITALPGQQPPRVDFEQYSGYVTVDEEHGRVLFYYFVESSYDAASKPLVLWLNAGNKQRMFWHLIWLRIAVISCVSSCTCAQAGPGCSSLGWSAMMELGPFRVNPDGKTLSRNRDAWNNGASPIC